MKTFMLLMCFIPTVYAGSYDDIDRQFQQDMLQQQMQRDQQEQQNQLDQMRQQQQEMYNEQQRMRTEQFNRGLNNAHPTGRSYGYDQY